MRLLGIAALPDGGKLEVSDGAAVFASSAIFFHAQSPCVVRLTRGENSTITGFVMSVGDMQFNYNFDYSEEVLIQLNTVLRGLLRYTLPTTTAINTTSTASVLSFTFYEGEDVVDTLSYRIAVADSVGWVSRSEFRGGYPETFYIPDDVAYGSYAAAYYKTSPGMSRIAFTNRADTLTDMGGVSFIGETLGRGLRSSDGFVYFTDNNNILVTRAVVERERCMRDKVFVRWWSLVDGCWKTRVARVKSEVIDIEDKGDYIAFFDVKSNKVGKYGLACCFEALTARDAVYYGDIMTASQVYVYQPYTLTPVAGVEDTAMLACSVEGGGVPTLLYGRGRVDLDFILNYKKTSII